MCTFSSAVQPECAVVLRVFCLHVYKCVLNRLTFLLSSWISAWVTACLIWSCRQREKQSDFFNKQINITKIKLGKTVNKRLNKIMTLTSKSFISHHMYLFELVGQFLWVQLHRRKHFLVFCQIENLYRVRKHRTHLLLLVCRIFTCLQVNTHATNTVTFGNSCDILCILYE